MPSKISRYTTTGWVQVSDLDALDTRITAVEVSAVPIGVLQIYGGIVEPAGWKFCYGQVVLRSDYPALFAVISTRFNTTGETATQFRLPDMRGQYPVGTNAGGTYFSQGVGEKYGTPNAIAVTHNHGMKSHVHHMNHYHGVNINSGNDSVNHQHVFDSIEGAAGGSFGAQLVWGSGVTSGHNSTWSSGVNQWHQHNVNGTSNWVYQAGSGGVGSPDYPDSAGNTFGPNDNTTNDGGSSGSLANLPPSTSVNYIIRVL